MDIAAIQQLIATHGYWALFLGTFLEGETVFLLAGVAAHQGLLDPRYVAAVALGGAFVGDQIFYLLGRWRGVELLARHRGLARKAVVARRLIRRHAVALILLSRFLYGLRMVIPLACGASAIKPRQFLLLNLTSALGWTLAFGGLGYGLAGWVFSHLQSLKALQALGGLVLAVVVLAGFLARLIQKRLLAVDRNSDADPPSESTS